MSLRNICPKNKAITYGVKDKGKCEEMGFEDHNIYNDVERARKKIENTETRMNKW